MTTAGPAYTPPLDPYVVVYRDAGFLVLDKPSGLLSVPGRDPALFDSLATRVRKDFPQAEMINRLDLGTSGLVLMSLDKKAHAYIAAQFEARTTDKLYTALVWGHMAEAEGFIDLPLCSDPERKPRHRVDHIHGKPSQTKWKAMEHLSTPATRVHLTPMTGRTHQLRVHMQAIGHTILGDPLYAEGNALAAAPRLMLHAQELTFRHPNGEEMTFTSPCPF